MASIYKEIAIAAPATQLWEAMRDVGALHTQLVPGFVTNCVLNKDIRTVSFANGMSADERIITVDDIARRVVWSSIGGRLAHHNASAQVFSTGPTSCKVIWIADLLPDDYTAAIAGMIEHGLAAMKRHAEIGRAIEAPMKLYVDSQFASPYAMSAFVCLREKGLAFDLIPVNLAAKENAAATYAQRSLTRRVPTLDHADFSLSESSAIAEYLDETFAPARLYPANPQQRARARQLQAWLRSDLMPIREERTTEVIFFSPSTRPLSESAQAAAQHLFAIADRLITAPEAGLFGNWCIADTDLALMLNRLVLNGDAVPDKLAAWAEHQWQRASIQEWVGFKRG